MLSVRKFEVQQALASAHALNQHINGLTEEEVLAALELESAVRRRRSVIDRLISRAARINELNYVRHLKEKYHGKNRVPPGKESRHPGAD